MERERRALRDRAEVLRDTVKTHERTDNSFHSGKLLSREIMVTN